MGAEAHQGIVSPQPLGLNRQGYRGERVTATKLLADLREVSSRHGWQEETLISCNALPLLALHRPASLASCHVYLSAGIHGDEPAGPLALHRLLASDHWPADTSLYVCPCLNPTGLTASKRENAQGRDLNRDYRRLRTEEVQAHVAWLNRQPRFDLTICLHEDWEARGFYLYELNPHRLPTRAERVIQEVSVGCPIDRSPQIDGRPAANGIIRPEPDPRARPDWPEAFYLLEHKTAHSFTLEAPSDFALPLRVKALVDAIHVLLETEGEG